MIKKKETEILIVFTMCIIAITLNTLIYSLHTSLYLICTLFILYTPKTNIVLLFTWSGKINSTQHIPVNFTYSIPVKLKIVKKLSGHYGRKVKAGRIFLAEYNHKYRSFLPGFRQTRLFQLEAMLFQFGVMEFFLMAEFYNTNIHGIHRKKKVISPQTEKAQLSTWKVGLPKTRKNPCCTQHMLYAIIAGSDQ